MAPRPSGGPWQGTEDQAIGLRDDDLPRSVSDSSVAFEDPPGLAGPTSLLPHCAPSPDISCLRAPRPQTPARKAGRTLADRHSGAGPPCWRPAHGGGSEERAGVRLRPTPRPDLARLPRRGPRSAAAVKRLPALPGDAPWRRP